jgi:hypothetical protein
LNKEHFMSDASTPKTNSDACAIVSESPGTSEQKPGEVLSKMNALTHGVYAEERVLPWEDPQDLMTLRDEIWEEYQVKGRSEEETALGLVWQFWLKRRVARAVQLPYHLGLSPEDRQSPPKSFGDLVSRVIAIADDGAEASAAATRAIEALEKAAAQILDIQRPLASHSSDETQQSALAAAGQAQRDAQFVRKMFMEQVFPRLIKLEEVRRNDGPSTAYEKAYSSAELEKLTRLEAMLDARIDKLIARLVRLQEYKRLSATPIKVVEHSPSS